MVTAQKKLDNYLCGNSFAESEAIKSFLKKKGIDPFRAKGIMSSIQAEEPEEEESDSSSSYVSTSDSDERRERKYRERMARTKAKLDFDIAALRTRGER